MSEHTSLIKMFTGFMQISGAGWGRQLPPFAPSPVAKLMVTSALRVRYVGLSICMQIKLDAELY